QLLVAANRAAAFGVAARWVLHDLRSPAQSLTLIPDLMADPDTEVEEILRESCGHLARSLDLLARVVHPSPTAEAGPISVREPLGFVADLHRAGRTHARLELAVQPSMPAASGVEHHLEHALLNLVLNATEALKSQEGGVIRITAGADADRIAIVVADNGPGLAPGLSESLFQAPLRSGKSAPLSGIGLFVAHRILGSSGGLLSHAPAPNSGARFVITLPLWHREAAASAAS
ncbi:MAG: sensor histidine kinase, partial [Gemmatimonadales bacterium]